MKQTYIHYGHTTFDKNIFHPIHNIPMRNKPTGGVWASRIDAVFGWRELNEYEFYKDCDKEISFQFTLKSNANIIELHSSNDVDQLLQITTSKDHNSGYLDFEAISSGGIDAIEYFLSDDDDLYYKLRGWECDSILIMNHEIIVPI